MYVLVAVGFQGTIAIRFIEDSNFVRIRKKITFLVSNLKKNPADQSILSVAKRQGHAELWSKQKEKPVTFGFLGIVGSVISDFK